MDTLVGAIAKRLSYDRRDDFDDPHELARFAATCGMTLAEFRAEFEYLVQVEPPPLVLGPNPEGAGSSS